MFRDIQRRCLAGSENSSERPANDGCFGKNDKRKKTDNQWEDGTPPPHRDFKERGVVR